MGLRKFTTSKFWNYKFDFKGVTYSGSTGHTNKNLAAAWLLDLRAHKKKEFDDAAKGIKKDPDTTCGELLTEWKANHTGSNLIRVSRDWLLHVPESFMNKRALDATAGDLEEIRTTYLKFPSLRNEHLKEQMVANGRIMQTKSHSNGGANKVVTHIQLVFGWAVKTGRLPRMPFLPLAELVTQDPVRTFLTKAQVTEYLEEIDRCRNLHVMVMVRAELYLALREDEARQMRWGTFNSDRTSYQPFDTKTGKIIPIPVPDDLRIMLDLLKEKVPEDCEWCCPAKDGQPHRAQITTKAIKRAATKLGIKGLTPHRMRGSCVTIMARQGANAFTIKRMGRWKRMETAEKYVEIIEDDLRAAQERAFDGK